MIFDHSGRIRRLRSRLAESSLDSILLGKRENVYYFSGFAGGDSLLLVTENSVFLISDFRYREQAEEELVTGCELRLRLSASLTDAAADLVREERLRRIGFEEEDISWAAWRRLRDRLSGKRLSPAGKLAGDLRVIKDPDEISSLRIAAGRTVRVLGRVRGSVRPGMSEADLARRLSAEFYRAGGEPAFPPIAAAGDHSSHPHAAASGSRFNRGEICLLDLGGKWHGYNADLTRTLVGGEFPRRFKTVYRAVLAAQKTALRAVRPGVRASELDGLARGYLADRGYGEYFGHGLGHGVGLEVHERPSVSSRSGEVLEEGMVFTVEPGVYIPGWGGIRIEDTVLVTAEGCEILTAAPKNLESCLLEW